MNYVKFSSVFIVVILLFAIQNVASRPAYRIKRVSDQRLAELETLLALSKIRNQLVTLPVGFGKIDPYKVGRRRRSASSNIIEKFLIDSESENSSFDFILDDLES